MGSEVSAMAIGPIPSGRLRSRFLVLFAAFSCFFSSFPFSNNILFYFILFYFILFLD